MSQLITHNSLTSEAYRPVNGLSTDVASILELCCKKSFPFKVLHSFTLHSGE